MNEMVDNFWIFEQKGSNIVNLLQDIIVNDNHITTMGTHKILEIRSIALGKNKRPVSPPMVNVILMDLRLVVLC
jgi:hypothetical protein